MRICMKNTLLCIENGPLCLNVCQRYYGHFCPGGTKGIQAFPFFLLFFIHYYFFFLQFSAFIKDKRKQEHEVCVRVYVCKQAIVRDSLR